MIEESDMNASRANFSLLRAMTLAGAALFISAWLLQPAAAQDRTLVIAMTGTPKGHDSDFWVPGQIESTVNVYEGLVRFGVKKGKDGRPEIDPGKIEPHLPKWSVSRDGKVYVFRIRPGVKSPFGNELTSADVVWTYNKSTALNAPDYS
jgi:ABC-type transport system substrate-binding protein